MTKKKSHLRRAPRHGHGSNGGAKTNSPAPPPNGSLEEIVKHNPPLIAGGLFDGTAADDRVKIRPKPGDPSMDYTMPRKEAMALLKQGKLQVSQQGGFEATDKYPGSEEHRE